MKNNFFWGVVFGMIVLTALFIYLGYLCSNCDERVIEVWNKCMEYKGNPVIDRIIKEEQIPYIIIPENITKNLSGLGG